MLLLDVLVLLVLLVLVLLLTVLALVLGAIVIGAVIAIAAHITTAEASVIVSFVFPTKYGTNGGTSQARLVMIFPVLLLLRAQYDDCTIFFL